MKQVEVLTWAFSFLKKYNREQNVAKWLWLYHTNQTKEAYYAQMRTEFSADIIARFKEDVMKHAQTGIPVQHLVGYAPFYSRDFIVNRHVLIPRFETEELVEHVIQTVNNHFRDETITIVDVGTGSGVIAITLALELTNVNVLATDISEQAITVAKENAKKHEVEVTFYEGDFLAPMIARDIQPRIIVSNPPYIAYAERESLVDTVKNFDPELALFAANDGLYAYETMVQQLMQMNLAKSTYVCFEIGYNQKEQIVPLVKKYFPKSKVAVKQDINGNDRIVTILLD